MFHGRIGLGERGHSAGFARNPGEPPSHIHVADPRAYEIVRVPK